MSDTPPFQPASPGDPRVLKLIRRISETEAELRALLGEQVDLVLDPATGTPIFFRETQQALLRAQEELRQVNEQLEQRVEERTAALRESETRFREMADGTPLIIWVTDASGRMLFVNRAYSQFFGVTLEDVQAGGWQPLVHPDDAPAYVAQYMTALQQHLPFRAEARVQRHDGEWRWIESFGEPRFSSSGEFVGMAGSSPDISDRKRAEEALRQSETRLQTLVAASSDVIYRMSPDWQEMIQLSSREFLDETRQPDRHWLQKYIHPDDQPYVQSVIHDAIRQKKVFELEHRVLRADGTVGWTFSRAVPLLDANGNIVEWFGAASDVTARKRFEEERERLLTEVQTRAAELNTMLDAIADGLVIYDTDGRVIRTNAAADRMMRYAPEEHGLPIPERIPTLRVEHPDGRPFAPDETPAMRALHGETTSGVIMVAHRPHGTLWTSVSAAPLRTADGAIFGAVVVFTDITALHELQEQQKVLIHLVSHDLRTPVTIIQGYADLLVDGLQQERLGGGLLDAADAIQRGIRRMNVMIEDLVDTARAEGGQLTLNRQAVALQQHLPDLLSRSAPLLEVDRVNMVIPTDLPPICADPDRLERILTNLLSNALKYSDPGTPVLVRAQPRDGEVMVSVTDQGRGIPPEAIPHLFERFYRVPGARKAEGIGLGLYITRMLVEAHGGRIWVESEVGKGSTFYFALPTASP
ncbi:MAG: PAS domain-containing sensor histidine kinase [Armatimonadota bacterium]